jgi:hypothetical protein
MVNQPGLLLTEKYQDLAWPNSKSDKMEKEK